MPLKNHIELEICEKPKKQGKWVHCLFKEEPWTKKKKKKVHFVVAPRAYLENIFDFRQSLR